MKIIKAIDYGYRTVIKVCHNPDDPAWVHVVGSHRLDGDGQPMFNEDGSAVLIVNATVPDGETWESCHNCRYNWDVTEIIFEASEIEGMAADDIWGLVCARCAPNPVPVVLADLVGRSDR